MTAAFGVENHWLLRRYGVFTVDFQIALDGEECILGRGNNRGIKYSSGVSRRHALLKRTANGEWKIRDLDSINGVFINSTKIAKDIFEPIREFDIIGLGVPVGTQDDYYSFILCRKPKLYHNYALTMKPVANGIRKKCGIGNCRSKSNFITQEGMADKHSTSPDCKKDSPDNLEKRTPKEAERQDEEVCILYHKINYKRKWKEVIVISDDSDSSDVEVIDMPQNRKVCKRKCAGLSSVYDEISGDTSCLPEKGKQEWSHVKVCHNGSSGDDDQNLQYSHTYDQWKQEKCALEYDVLQSPHSTSKDSMVEVETVHCLQTDGAMVIPQEENVSAVMDDQRKLDKSMDCTLPSHEVESSSLYHGENCRKEYIREKRVSNGSFDESPESSDSEMPIEDTVDDSFNYDIDSGIDEEELRSRIVWSPQPEVSDTGDVAFSQIPKTFVNEDQQNSENSNSGGIKELSITSSLARRNENSSQEIGKTFELVDQYQPSDDGGTTDNRDSNPCNYNHNSYLGITGEQPNSNTILHKTGNKKNPLSSSLLASINLNAKRNIKCRENSMEKNCFPQSEMGVRVLNSKKGKSLESKRRYNSVQLIYTPMLTKDYNHIKELHEKENVTKDRHSLTYTDGVISAIPKQQRLENLNGALFGNGGKYKTWSKCITGVALKLPQPNYLITRKTAFRTEAVQRFASRTSLLIQSMLNNKPSLPVKIIKQ